MHTSYVDMKINIPLDRNGSYEPQTIKKYQNTLTQDKEGCLQSFGNRCGRQKRYSWYVGENESAKFRLSKLNGLKNIGVRDILIACIDELTVIQHCIIHVNEQGYLFSQMRYPNLFHGIRYGTLPNLFHINA